jgi:hypothetical protein
MTAAGAGQQIAAFARMMLPAIMQARTAARRTMSRNHLKQAVLADGSFRFISSNLSSSILKGLFTRNGGEVVSGAF